MPRNCTRHPSSRVCFRFVPSSPRSSVLYCQSTWFRRTDEPKTRRAYHHAASQLSPYARSLDRHCGQEQRKCRPARRQFYIAPGRHNKWRRQQFDRRLFRGIDYIRLLLPATFSRVSSCHNQGRSGVAKARKHGSEQHHHEK
jgi:hypothetical protein